MKKLLTILLIVLCFKAISQNVTIDPSTPWAACSGSNITVNFTANAGVTAPYTVTLYKKEEILCRTSSSNNSYIITQQSTTSNNAILNIPIGDYNRGTDQYLCSNGPFGPSYGYQTVTYFIRASSANGLSKDYPINIKNGSLSCPPILGVRISSLACSGKSLNLEYVTAGIDPSNIFTFLLSDQNGSFSNAIILTNANTTNLTSTVEIPLNLSYSYNYKLKLISNSPASEAISDAFEIGFTKPILSNRIVCDGNKLVIGISTGNSSLHEYNWYKDDLKVISEGTTIYEFEKSQSSYLDSGKYKVVSKRPNDGCVVESNENVVNVLPAETITSGVWNNAAIWNCNNIPLLFSSAKILAPHSISLNGSNIEISKIINEGLIGDRGNITGNLENIGKISPSNPIGITTLGTINIIGNMICQPSSILDMEINNVGITDQILLSNLFQINGTLNVILKNGFLPALGDKFTLMTYGSYTGAFATVNLPTLPNGLFWSLSYKTMATGGRIAADINELVLTVTNTALPLKLLSFNVISVNSEAHLSWLISEATNASHFEIERSENSDKFSKIGEVKIINSDEKINYKFIDYKPKSGINYYRLKSIDFDGKFEYSKIISAKVYDEFETIIFPNPAKNILEIRETDSINNPLILSLLGKIISKPEILDNKISVENLASGIYILQYEKIGKTHFKKFIKQ